MIKTKNYNYSDKILDFVFVKLDQINSDITIPELLKNVSESIIISDTNGTFILDALKQFGDFLNQYDKIIVGLTNDKTLNEIRESGVQNGFFRSTNEKLSLGLIIVDKKQTYVAFDANHIYEIPLKYTKELFEYINHIIWSKSNYEQCQGSLRTVEETMLSVMIPKFSDNEEINKRKIVISTELDDLKPSVLILNKEKETKSKSRVSLFDFNGYSQNFSTLNVNLFGDRYYPISVDADSLYKSESFEDKQINMLINKDVWYKNNWYFVTQKETLSKEIFVPLNEVNNFEPNFDEIEKTFNGLTQELEINVVINSIKLDSTYSISPKYKLIDKIEAQLEENLLKLSKLDKDEIYSNQIASIKGEKNLNNKIKMYNQLINAKEFGLEVLNNKKSPLSIINVNASDLIVPSPLIGKLYVKGDKNYLATTLDQLDNATQWMKENKIEATLIEE